MLHYAVIGYPIAHSRSPQIYGELFRKYGVDADFTRVSVRPEEFSSIRRITEKLNGFAVTMPYKKAIIPYIDELSDTARSCGAVNIVLNRDGVLIGFNTDGDGLCDALEEAGAMDRADPAVILGRGGAALSAARALHERGVGAKLLVRTPSLHPAFPEEPVDSAEGPCGLFVNATPLGMAGGEEFSRFDLISRLSPKAVLDMVYKDGDTALIGEAKRRGLTAVDGGRMLYYQALRAFEIWTGIKPRR